MLRGIQYNTRYSENVDMLSFPSLLMHPHKQLCRHVQGYPTRETSPRGQDGYNEDLPEARQTCVVAACSAGLLLWKLLDAFGEAACGGEPLAPLLLPCAHCAQVLRVCAGGEWLLACAGDAITIVHLPTLQVRSALLG